MKSLGKLRKFALPKNDASKEKRDAQHSAHVDELAQASQDMQEMRNCYDSLLSAAAATTNSAYGYGRSLPFNSSYACRIFSVIGGNGLLSSGKNLN